MNSLVIPAKAGTQTPQTNLVASRRHFPRWAPAFAGVTESVS